MTVDELFRAYGAAPNTLQCARSLCVRRLKFSVATCYGGLGFRSNNNIVNVNVNNNNINKPEPSFSPHLTSFNNPQHCTSKRAPSALRNGSVVYEQH